MARVDFVRRYAPAFVQVNFGHLDDLLRIHDLGGAGLAEALDVALTLAQIWLGPLRVIGESSLAGLERLGHFLNGFADNSGLPQRTGRLIFRDLRGQFVGGIVCFEKLSHELLGSHFDV